MYKMKLTPNQRRAGATRRRVPGYRARAASNPSRFSKGKKGAHQARMAHTMERFRDRMRKSGSMGGKLGTAISVLKPPRGVGRKPRRASAGVKPRTRRAGTRQILRPASRRPKTAAVRRPTKQFKPVRKRPVRASAPSNAWRAPKRGSRPVRRKAMPQRAKNVTRRKVTNRRGGTGPQRNWAKSTPLIRSAAKKYRGYRR